MPDTIDKATPADSDLASAGAAQFRALKTAIENRMAIADAVAMSTFFPFVTTVTDIYTQLIQDGIIICNKATAFNLTILAAANCSGRVFRVKNIGAGVVTLVGTIGGVVDRTLAQNKMIEWFSDGTTLYVTLPLVVFRGALVYRGSSFTVGNNQDTFISWDLEDYDTDNIHDPAVNPERLTVPSGVTKVRLSGSVALPSDTDYTKVQLQIWKGTNGSFIGGAGQHLPFAGNFSITVHVHTPVIQVVAGDYFRLNIIQQNTDATIQTVTNLNSTWFTLLIIE